MINKEKQLEKNTAKEVTKMRKKIGKIFIVLILIISILYVPMPKTYASLIENAKSEGEAYVPPPPVEDDPNPPPIGNPPSETDEIKRTTKYYHTAISGNVYEKLGLSDESGESNTKAIKNVLAYLINPKGECEQTAWTDENGYYYFAPQGTGTYTTKFAYGLIRRCK